jgi:hypothetical protein
MSEGKPDVENLLILSILRRKTMKGTRRTNLGKVFAEGRSIWRRKDWSETEEFKEFLTGKSEISSSSKIRQKTFRPEADPTAGNKEFTLRLLFTSSFIFLLRRRDGAFLPKIPWYPLAEILVFFCRHTGLREPAPRR